MPADRSDRPPPDIRPTASVIRAAPAEPFERLARLAARALNRPMALIVLFNPAPPWTKAHTGLDAPSPANGADLVARAMPAPHQYVALPDLHADAALRTHPAVEAGGVAALAAAPLPVGDTSALGALAVLDDQPRPFDAAARTLLHDLAATTAHHIEQSLHLLRTRAQRDEAERFFLHAPDPQCTLSVQGTILRANPALAHALGYERAELEGRTYLDIVHPEDRADAIDTVQRLARGDEVDLFTVRARRADGTYRTLEWNSLICEEDIIYASARDITELKRLRRTLPPFQEAVESTSDAIAILDPKGQILYLNPTFEAMHGVTAEELDPQTGSPLSLFADEHFGDELIATVRAGAAWQGEVTMKGPEGQPLDVILRINPIVDDDGTVRAIVCIHTDITEQKRIEEALRQSEKLAATGRMAAGIAHEINNPLAGIKNAFQLVKQAIPEGHEHASFVERIDAEIERIRRIVHQMYTLYTPDQETPRRVRLGELLADARLVLEPSAREHRVTLAVNDATQGRPLLLAEGQLRQVLYNLIDNAIVASPADSTVELAADMNGSDLILQVIDAGTGIAPEVQDQIFDPFFSYPVDRDRDEPGLGLGLSVSRTLVEAMGGSLTFDTEPGAGTTFTVRLPIRPAPPSASNEK